MVRSPVLRSLIISIPGQFSIFQSKYIDVPDEEKRVSCTETGTWNTGT